MTPNEFTVWLKGYFAALGDEPPTRKDWRTITEKLAQVKPKPQWEAHSCDIPGCAVCDPCYGL